MTKIILDKKGICEYQQNRDPYLMIDYASEIIPGKSANGYKDLKNDEWFFKVHWKNDPNMPGMLQIEALVQMSALSILTLPGNKGKVMYLSKLTDSKFKKKVIIGDRLDLYAEVISYKRGIAKYYGKGTVKEQKVCEASFELVLPDEVNKFKINK